MLRDTTETDGYDPTVALRRRVTDQLTAESADPVAPAGDAGSPAAPVAPAPFDAAAPGPDPGMPQGYTPPDPPPYVTPGSSPTPGVDAARVGITDPPVQAPDTTQQPSTSIGSGLPWAAGASAPTGAPPGYHWDPNMANFAPDAAATNQVTPTPRPPTSGSLTDPSFAQQFVAWMGTQPGVNPSVKNDPGYWIGRFTSGAFGNDQNYAIARMMQAEGAPEGAGAPAPGAAPRATTSFVPAPIGGGGGGLPQTSLMQTAGLQTPQGLWSPDFIAQLRQVLMQRMAGDSARVDPNDPNISEPLSAAKDQLSRQSDTERNQLAERLYAQGGLNSDALGQGIQQSNERTGTALSGLRANLIVTELNNRRQDLQQAMQLAVQAGDAESAQNISLQIAALSAQIQREGIGANLAIQGQNFNQNASNAVTGR